MIYYIYGSQHFYTYVYKCILFAYIYNRNIKIYIVTNI